jgi:GGDEF domain-containing protein
MNLPDLPPDVNPESDKEIKNYLETTPEILDIKNLKELVIELQKEDDTQKRSNIAQSALILLHSIELNSIITGINLFKLRHFFISIGRSILKPEKFNSVIRKNLAARIHALKEGIKEIFAYAYLDNVTGISNRQYFFKQFEERLQRFKPNKTNENLERPDPITIIFIDLDGFKNVNDVLSHNAGDQVLKLFGQTLYQVFSIKKNLLGFTLEQREKDKPKPNKQDIAGRYGGDEFVIVTEKEETIIQHNIEKVRTIFQAKLQREIEKLEESAKRSEQLHEKIELKQRAEKMRMVFDKLGFSHGIVVVEYPELRRSDRILTDVDEHMYSSKNERKKQNGLPQTREG